MGIANEIMGLPDDFVAIANEWAVIPDASTGLPDTFSSTVDDFSSLSTTFWAPATPFPPPPLPFQAPASLSNDHHSLWGIGDAFEGNTPHILTIANDLANASTHPSPVKNRRRPFTCRWRRLKMG